MSALQVFEDNPRTLRGAGLAIGFAAAKKSFQASAKNRLGGMPTVRVTMAVKALALA